MIPQIALDLSLDTIAVLSRAPEGGWWREGTVRLTDPDMPERLANLRDVAEARVGPDFLSLLVLPDSQLLYTSLERDDRRPDDTIRSLLKGRTPYAVEDLTWDYVERGDRLQVAVVALDTLMEAETFAAEYGFRPVAVVASPSDPAYPGIPAFGKTGLAGDLLNGEPLDLSLDGGFRATPAPPLPKIEAEAEAEAESALPEAQDNPASEAAETAEPDAAADAPEDTSAAPDAAAAPLPTFRRNRAEVAPDRPAIEPPQPEESVPQDGFSSTRAGSPEPPVARTASGERLARIAPRLTAQPGPASPPGRGTPPLPTPADIEATGKREARYPSPRATAPEPPLTAPAAPPVRFDAPRKSDVPEPEAKIPPVAPPGSFAAHLKRRAADPDAVAEWKAEAEARGSDTDPAPEAKAKRYDVPREKAPAMLAARIKRRAEEAKTQQAAPAVAVGATLPDDAEMALPGLAREAEASRGGSRLGLFMTLGLLAVLVLVGVAAALMGTTEDDVAAPPARPAAAPLTERADLAVSTPTEAPSEPAPEADLAILLPEPGSVTTGSAGPSVIAAPEPITAPVLARVPDRVAEAEDQLQADVAPSLAAAPALETAPSAETSPAVFIEIWEADGTFEAPDLAAPPVTSSDPQPVFAALDPGLTGLATPGVPQVPAAPSALAPRRDPPPAELVESRDAALGLTPATPDWTVLPEGYALLRGRPATLTRARPGGAAEARLAALAETPQTAPDASASDGTLPDEAGPTGAVAEIAADVEGRSDDAVAPVLVAATAQGSLAPGGYTVLQGRPATLPLRRPETALATPEAAEVEADDEIASTEDDPTPGPDASDTASELVATEDGVVAPGGFTLVLGRPETLPEPRPIDETAETDAAEAIPADAPLTDPEGDAQAAPGPTDEILRRVRPVARPGAIDAAAAAQAAALAAEAEAEERALAELRRLQPRPRPEGISVAAEEAEAALQAARAATEQAAVDAAQQAAAASLASRAVEAATQPTGQISDLALLESERPRTRPRSVERDAARIVTQRRQVAAAASAATTQPRQPAPSAAPSGTQQIRSAGGNVARAATQQNVIRLNRINLIGVYGRSNARRALVRLSNGRYVKVEVGDRLDRGRVVAIGDDRLQYQRGGRNVVLELPRT